MIRTQVYLPEDLYRDAALLAQRDKESISQVIRDGLRNLLARRKKSEKCVNPFIGVIGIYQTGKKISGQKAIDEYYRAGVV